MQGLGWTVFELLVIATAAAALSDELFGFRAQWLWTIVFGLRALVLALLGPIGFVRRFIRRFAIWAAPLALVYLTWWTLDGADLGALWDAEGEGGLTIWQGADVVVGITVSQFAADHALLEDAAVPSQERASATSFPTSGSSRSAPYWCSPATSATRCVTRSRRRGRVRRCRRFALLVTETDEAFANAYSASVSLQNAFPRAPQALLIVLVTAVATVGALIVDIGSYQSFLLLLGSVFVLLAVLLADWLAAGAHYTADDVFVSPAWRAGLVGAWVAGFALYQWLYPTGPARWVDLVGELNPPEWSIGATVPASSSRSSSRSRWLS